MVQVAWLTGTAELNQQFAAMLRQLHPELELLAVSEFPAPDARWIPYHPKRTGKENREFIQAALQSESVRVASLLLVPRTAYGALRRIALGTHGVRLAVYDRNLNRRGWPAQLLRFTKDWSEWHARPASPVRRWLRRIGRPSEALIPLYAKLAYRAARLRRTADGRPALPIIDTLPGVSVIVPSRNGVELLRDCLPLILSENPTQIIVVDNGSTDNTAAWLAGEHPRVRVIVNREPLSFARAINIGLQQARHARVLLLNNDMRVERGFLAALESAFQAQPDLFCATAQILFPTGARREETGKAVLRQPETKTEFPVRCEVPLEEEDGTWVLYGSGGCSLFDTAKARALGGLNELFRPAYVEDLDLGFRAWQHGWPTIFCANARAEHRHRSTTARYFTAAELDTMVQTNFLLFLASAIADATLFRNLWNQAIRRLHLTGAKATLRAATTIPKRVKAPPKPARDEAQILALTNGDVAVFPGRVSAGKPAILIATPYLPYPLSHGGAVRIFNLMREASAEFDLILLSFAEHWQPPPAELLALTRSTVLVRRHGSHYRVSTSRPDTVEEFASDTFRAALRQSIAQWSPGIVQLEWTQMAQYAPDCAPAKTILVEHDVTFDLYEQMALQAPDNLEIRTQLERWRAFETDAWQHVDRVVTMADKDRAATGVAHAVTIPNGVDTERYQPSDDPDDNETILFIGSFAHHPNRSGVEWFLREVWPLLEQAKTRLHIIAGADYMRWPVAENMRRVRVEGFIADVRPAYRKAAVVIAPLLASAGTNIKILEAMAMGKAIVSTKAGVNGLEVDGVEIANTPKGFTNSILSLLRDRGAAGARARYSVAQRYSWRTIARTQSALYRELLRDTTHEVPKRDGKGADAS